VTLSLGGGTDFTNTRAPSLRDLVAADGTPHSGFMHNAILPDLMAVIEHYNAIPAVVLPNEGMSLSFSGTGIDRTVTLSISAVANLDYIVQSSIDMRAWVDTRVKASPLGEVTATLAASSGTPKCFYRVVYVPGGGAPPEE
jgi:hypothetical protein